MQNSFINPQLSKNNLESFIIRNEIFKAILNAIPLFKGNVLDSGCGSMAYKEIVLSNGKVKNYTGLDIESSLNYEGVKADFLWDGKKMPFEDASFDVVISTEVLEHVPDPDTYLMEVKRVLKPGGMFFFTVPFLMSLHEVPNDYYRYTPFALEMIFKRVGFTDIRIKSMGGYNAALAQMLGLWVNMYLWGKKKKIMRIIVKPLIKILYKKDRPSLDFKKSTMMVGLSGIVVKPIVRK
jgi:SAM-dependent methyltransferase